MLTTVASPLPLWKTSTHWVFTQVNLSLWLLTCSLTDEQVKMLQDIAVKCVRHLQHRG